MLMVRKTMLAAVMAAALTLPAQATTPATSPARGAPSGDAAADAAQAILLPLVQVTAPDIHIQLDVPGTVSIIDRQQMDRHLVTTIRDMVQYEPGVSVVGSAGRFGLDSFNIRGLSGNRTRIEVDGVSMPSSFGADVAGGSFRAGRDFIDLDSIKRAEIVRGPASALFPSDALGGVVSLQTKDPVDYLRSGKGFYSALKEQYDSVDRSLSSTLTLAGGNKHHGLLMVMNHRAGHATDNQGEVGGTGNTRTRPDPLSYTLDSFLGKYVHAAASGRTDRIIVAGSKMRTHTNGLSELVPSRGVAPDYYRSRDRSLRVRVSVGQAFTHLNAALADTLDWHAYWQKSRTRTRTQTDDGVIHRFYDNLPLQEKVAGGKLVAVKRMGESGAVSQVVSYGVEASRTNAQSEVDGYGINMLTGVRGKSSPFMPGDYPLHLIPESDTSRYSLFGQDELSVFGGRLVVTPGLRIDRYEYKPDADALYQSYNPGYVQRNYKQNHASPKLGLIWHLNDTLSVYADYAYGFRPPLYSEIAGAWNEQPVPGINIAFLPNPDLKAETSRGAALGVRGKGAAGWFGVDAYYNRYRNFIWSGYQLAPGDVPAWAYQISPGAFFNQFFQSVNARRAHIKGVETSGALQLGYFSDALQNWSVRGSATIATGRLIEPGDSGYSPLNTVAPAKLVAGVSYNAPNWGAELVGTAVRRHAQLSDPGVFRPPGYATLDFYAHYKPAENLEFYAGASNLTDRKYWDWGSLNGGTLGNLVSGNGLNDAGPGSLPADRLTMPGRSFSLAVKLSF